MSNVTQAFQEDSSFRGSEILPSVSGGVGWRLAARHWVCAELVSFTDPCTHGDGKSEILSVSGMNDATPLHSCVQVYVVMLTLR